MLSISYYDPKVNGEITSLNLTTDKAFEILAELTGFGAEEMQAAKELFHDLGCELTIVHSVYGNITILDQALLD